MRCNAPCATLAARTASSPAGRNDRSSTGTSAAPRRSEEHTSELQSLRHLVCRLLLEKKKHIQHIQIDLYSPTGPAVYRHHADRRDKPNPANDIRVASQ